MQSPSLSVSPSFSLRFLLTACYRVDQVAGLVFLRVGFFFVECVLFAAESDRPSEWFTDFKRCFTGCLPKVYESRQDG